MSFVESLKKSRDEIQAQQADPWHLRLDGIKGKVGDDGVERISTQKHADAFRHFGSPATAPDCGCLPEASKTDAGTRVVTHKGAGSDAWRLKDQVRGYAKDKDSLML